jgi:hypothetical protein
MYHWCARDPSNIDRPLGLMPHQREFAYGKASSILLAGGWGSAKTYGGVGFIDWKLYTNPGRTGIVMQPTHRLLRDFVRQEFLPAFGHMITGQSKIDNEWYLRGGRRVIFLSGFVPARLEKYKAAWAYIDEGGLFSSEIFPRIWARLRDSENPQLGITGTPIWGWLKDKFDKRNDSERKIIHARTQDNVFLHPSFIENLRASCPARLAEAYLNGQFVPPGGTVYPEFDEAVHCIDWKPQPQFPIGVIIDWGARSPHVLFVQRIPRGTLLKAPAEVTDRDGAVVFDELIVDGSSQSIMTDRLCHLILAKYSKIHWGACDPADGGVHPTSGLNQIGIANRILDIKLRFTTDPKLTPIKAGIEHLKSMLHPFAGKPSLYFARSLLQNHSPRAMLNAIRAYSYPKEKDGKPMDDEPEKDGISDHAVDCLRYCAINYFPIIRLQSTVRSAA